MHGGIELSFARYALRWKLFIATSSVPIISLGHQKCGRVELAPLKHVVSQRRSIECPVFKVPYTSFCRDWCCTVFHSIYCRLIFLLTNIRSIALEFLIRSECHYINFYSARLSPSSRLNLLQVDQCWNKRWLVDADVVTPPDNLVFQLRPHYDQSWLITHIF